jgi:hypothetical protein
MTAPGNSLQHRELTKANDGNRPYVPWSYRFIIHAMSCSHS